MIDVNKSIILVVEDEQPLLNVIQMKLEDSNFTVVSARSVKQALDYLDNMPEISAVWMDHYLLGEDDGLVLVAKLKDSESKYKNIPVFIVSNTASDDKVRAYLNLGVNKFFVKSDNSLGQMVEDITEAISENTTI